MLGNSIQVSRDVPLNNASVEVFPNPANEYLTIRLSEHVNLGEWQVRDMQGKVVRVFDWENGKREFRLDTRELPAGTYFLRANDGQRSFSKEIVILR